MCTAVTYRTRDHYFGRNLDLEYSYQETVTRFLAEIRSFCASRAVPYLLVKSNERVEDVLRTRGCMEELIR